MADLTHALSAEEVTRWFETHENGLRYAWLGEDDEHAVVWGHGLDPVQIAVALGLDGDVVRHTADSEAFVEEDYESELTERWMVAARHQEGCDEDGCTCDEYAWWVVRLSTEEAIAAPTGIAIAVTEWMA